MGRRELSPARMRRSIGFTCSQVRKLGWLWVQWMIVRWKRSCEILNKRVVWWTGLSVSASDRFGNRLLKAQRLVRSQHVWGQNTGGPRYCSDLEHTASADCAFSFFYDSLPIFCLLFRHRISFQPLGLASKSKVPSCCYDLLDECPWCNSRIPI